MEYLREKFEPLTLKIAKPFTIFHPNAISLFGVLLYLPGVFFYSIGQVGLGALFVIGVLFDKVDGDVAKLTNKKTPFGGVLDATLDRFTEGLVLMSIGIGGLAPWWLIFMVFNTSICISYIKAKAETVAGVDSVGKNKFSIGLTQRGDRVVILLVGSILAAFFGLIALLISLYILLVAQSITILWRGIVIYNVLKK